MGWRASLETCDVATGRIEVVLRSTRLIEAPNWHPDGWFLVNAEGRLWRAEKRGLTAIDTKGLDRCNNDHGILPDGRIVLTCHDAQGAAMHVVDADGPSRLPAAQPSWWHGAQPNGSLICHACARGGDRVVRIATLDLRTGTERVLTPAAAHHDGPDFSACGGVIWFNSDATGQAQIWRMDLDGRHAAPVFRDDRVNWFPHPSPCGRHVVYLSYPPGTEGHPRDRPVELWLMAPDGTRRRKVVDLWGGQGTLNVPCWSPDGGAFAFIRYAPA